MCIRDRPRIDDHIEWIDEVWEDLDDRHEPGVRSFKVDQETVLRETNCWFEFPVNPVLSTSDFEALRALFKADEFSVEERDLAGERSAEEEVAI